MGTDPKCQFSILSSRRQIISNNIYNYTVHTVSSHREAHCLKLLLYSHAVCLLKNIENAF